MFDPKLIDILYKGTVSEVSKAILGVIHGHSDLASQEDLFTGVSTILETFLMDIYKEVFNVELEIKHIRSSGDCLVIRKYNDYTEDNND